MTQKREEVRAPLFSVVSPFGLGDLRGLGSARSSLHASGMGENTSTPYINQGVDITHVGRISYVYLHNACSRVGGQPSQCSRTQYMDCG